MSLKYEWTIHVLSFREAWQVIGSFLFPANDLPAEWALSQGRDLPKHQIVNRSTDMTHRVTGAGEKTPAADPFGDWLWLPPAGEGLKHEESEFFLLVAKIIIMKNKVQCFIRDYAPLGGSILSKADAEILIHDFIQTWLLHCFVVWSTMFQH